MEVKKKMFGCFFIATEAQQNHYKKLQTILKELPWYIEEYIDHKRCKFPQLHY